MTVLAFLFTLLELAVIAVSYALQMSPVFLLMVQYGSPMYLFRTLLGSDSVLMSGNPYYIGMFVFHILKYLTLVRAQVSGERGTLFWLAVIFEAGYLILCGYYMY